MVGLQQACSSLKLSGEVNRVHVKEPDLAVSPALFACAFTKKFSRRLSKWVTACLLTCFDSL
jgi:hypothetical protein